MKRYRNELKYEIRENQIHHILSNLKQIMNIDTNAKSSGGKYVIRSLYLDNYSNSCFYENEDGVDNREKYRIRMYNKSIDFLRFEIKHKDNGLTYKESTKVDWMLVKELLQNELVNRNISSDAVLNKLIYLNLTEHYKPKVIVEYDRVPFVCVDGNVRVTLDLNIRATKNINSFFDDSINPYPIMPIGKHILEVKYDQFLPEYIYSALNIGGLERVTFSKYYLSMKYGGIHDVL